MKVNKHDGTVLREVCGPEVQSLHQSNEEDDDTKQGEEDGGVQGINSNSNFLIS